MPTKLRKMVFFQSGNLLLRILFNKFRQKRPIGWLGRAQFVTGINLLFTLLLYSRSLARRRRHPAPGTPGFFSSILVQKDFFLVPHVKEQLAGLTLTADSVKAAWDGKISKEAFAASFRRWCEHCE